MPPAPQFPLPPVVRLTNVEPGDSAVGEAGAILRVVGTATAGLTGDDAGLFRIDGVETLQLVKDPDAPARAWETVSEATGPGPVDGGPGFGVTVRFTCPDQPAKETFTAAAVLTVSTGGTSVTHDFPVAATVLPENLTVQLNSPSFFLGEEKDLTVTVSSTYRRDVAGLLSISSTHPSAFSFGKLVSAVTVPTLGTASVTIPVRCTATATGDYEMTAVLEPDGTAASAADTASVRVLGRRAATVTSSFASQLALFHPSNTPGTLIVSVKSDTPVTVFFETIGTPETVSLTMPQSAPVDIGATVPVTINLPASPPPSGFTDAFAPITLAWVIPPDDFHPDEVKGSLVLAEVSFPPQVRTMPSGELGADTASGFATLTIQQDGSVNFQGHAHDSGFFGGQYLVGMWFTDVLDDQGRTIMFVREHDIAGTIGGGDSRDDDWSINGPSDPAMKKYISDHWDMFKSSNYSSSMIFNSDADIDVFTIFVGTLAEIGIAGIVVYLLG